MPGTIRVSVLEFMDLPELLVSPISIKVSMGKRHYSGTSDKGDFSFPLTTLRDDVILVVQDAGGNDISCVGVQAKSIVEKGYWDDHFPLEGGGRVRLQFQFALSEDDRNRIRLMRETALRRKQVERQERNLKSSGSNLASSFYLNPELSDSQKCLLQIGDLSAKEAVHQSPSASTENIPDVKPVTEKTNNIGLAQIQPLSLENDADRDKNNSSSIPLRQEADVNKPILLSIENNGDRDKDSFSAIPLLQVDVKPILLSSENDADRIEDNSSAIPLVPEVDVNKPIPFSVENDADRNKDNSSAILLVQEVDVNKPIPFSVENDADRNKDNSPEIPLVQEVDVSKPKVNTNVLVRRMGTQSRHVKKPSPIIRSEESLFHSQGSELSNSPSKDEGKTDAMEAPSRRKAPGPSNVKKVISAFESSLTQDTKPRFKPTLRNAQQSVVEKQVSLKLIQLKKATDGEDNTEPTLSEMTIGRPLAAELTHDLANMKQKEQKRKFIEDPRGSLKLKGKKNEVVEENLSEKDKMHMERVGIDVDAKNGESYQKLVPEKADCDINSVTGELVSHVEDEQFPSKRSDGKNEEPYQKVMSEKPDYDRNSVTSESVSCVEDEQFPSKRSGGKNGESYQNLVPEKPDHDRNSVACVEDEKFLSQRSDDGIFLDERRRLCVTTGGNHMLDQVGSRTSYTFIRKAEMKISTEENRSTSERKANGGKHNHNKMIKPESSDDVKPFEGPLANALKIAIMVGFGTLVLLTRQRKKKR